MLKSNQLGTKGAKQMLRNAKWIAPERDTGEVCPLFYKEFSAKNNIKSAVLHVTATGVYEAELNGKRVSDFILAPGLTVYKKRLQYQAYDVTNDIKADNTLCITLGKGWYRGRINEKNPPVFNTPGAVIASLKIEFEDGETEELITDGSWRFKESKIRFSDFFDGEIYDASFVDNEPKGVIELNIDKSPLIPQEGTYVTEHERLKCQRFFVTNNAEQVLDFGQNMAGYIEVSLKNTKPGDVISLSFGEVLDNDGNFYNKNYRTARSQYKYICRGGGYEVYKPHFTFYGFRYVRIDEFPGKADPCCFTAVALYSDMEQTGNIRCGDERLNKLFSNVIWGQRSNFIDVPMDCPQRDERQPWTGDAQIFCKTAAYNYDVKAFFKKWINDLVADQFKNGAIPDKSPNSYTIGRLETGSAGWGDAITVVPWTMYLMYGEKDILEASFDAMKRWVDYITGDTMDQYLWTCPQEQKRLWGHHYGDWLAPDTPDGGFKGATDDDVVASAFYAYSTSILIKSGNVLGKDVSEYEELYRNIVSAYKARFPDPKTQTDHVLALYFNLTNDRKGVTESLKDKIIADGTRLQTGFIGTPYLLYALSDNGQTELAYDLLLSERLPSWLYEVKHGATTVWEHWDAIMPDGRISTSSNGMDSFNHYAFGSVANWIYSVAAGIRPDESKPGFEHIIIEPKPDKRLGHLEATLKTKYGIIRSKWEYTDNVIQYEFDIPTSATIIINGTAREVGSGQVLLTGAAEPQEHNAK